MQGDFDEGGKVYHAREAIVLDRSDEYIREGS